MVCTLCLVHLLFCRATMSSKLASGPHGGWSVTQAGRYRCMHAAPCGLTAAIFALTSYEPWRLYETQRDSDQSDLASQGAKETTKCCVWRIFFQWITRNTNGPGSFRITPTTRYLFNTDGAQGQPGRGERYDGLPLPTSVKGCHRLFEYHIFTETHGPQKRLPRPPPHQRLSLVKASRASTAAQWRQKQK